MLASRRILDLSSEAERRFDPAVLERFAIDGVLDVTLPEVQALLPDESSSSWAEYISARPPDVRPYLEVARQWLLALPGGIPTADEWCNENCLLFSDGAVIDLNWNDWGHFVAAV